MFDELNVLSPEQENRISKYFKEMELSSWDIQRRIEYAKKFYYEISDIFRQMLDDLTQGKFIHDYDENYYLDKLMDLYLRIAPDPTDGEMIAKAERFATQILNTNKVTISKEIEDDDTDDEPKDAKISKFKKGILLGLLISISDIPKRILKLYSSERAITCALNETNYVNNYENHKDLVKRGQLTHTWLSMKDEKVRLTHWVADGQTKPIDEPFEVGGYKMRFPLDDSLGAPASEILGCRCIEM